MAFQLSEVSGQVQALLADAHETFRTYEKFGLQEDALPPCGAESKGAVKVVFVGPYSSGKSSIIKMLTGIDTGIDADIKTNKSAVYEWNGIEIVDTPGIETGLHPDHDAITYEEILHADLLIFVVTNEGFDQAIGAHFRKLAIDHQRGANMILVVNKMDRTALGNVSEQQQVMLSDIEQVTTPFTAEQLYTSFLSTTRYDEAMAEEDEELKQELMEESGYETFVAHLNAFVEEKKIGARLQKPLHELDGAIAEAQEAAAGEARNALETLAQRKLRILKNTREECRSGLQSIAGTARTEIEGYGRDASHAVGANSSPDDAEETLQKANADVRTCMQTHLQEMNSAFGRFVEQAEEAYEQELQKDFAKTLLHTTRKLDIGDLAEQVAELQDESLDDAVHRKTLDSVSKQALVYGADLTKNALNSTKMAEALAKSGTLDKFNTLFGSSLKNFKGSSLHKTIQETGKFFGVKFKPLEISKYTQWLGMAGKAMAAAGIVYEGCKLLTDSERAREEEKKFQDVRKDIRKSFAEAADGFYEDACKEIDKLLAASIDPAIEQMKEELERMDAEKEERQSCSDALRALQDRTYELRAALQADAS